MKRRLFADSSSGTATDAHRWFRDVARVVDVPWDMAAGGDLVFPGVPGRRTRKILLLNAYLAWLQTAAEHDAALASAFIRVAGLVDPPASSCAPASFSAYYEEA